MISPHPQKEVQIIYDDAAVRYDWQHALITAGTDKKGREWLIDKSVRPGMNLLDAGSGTGSTGIAAAHIVGKNGSVTFFDLSSKMLDVAKKKAHDEQLDCSLFFETGDLHHLPFPDNHFDAVLSTYSLDPLHDPVQAFRELYRVTKNGGLIGVAHEVIPNFALLRIISIGIERVIWHLPKLGLACRPVEIIPLMNQFKGEILDQKRIGVPLWPFQLFVFRKAF